LQVTTSSSSQEWNSSRTSSSSSHLEAFDGDLSPPLSVRSSLSGSRRGSNGTGGLTKKVSFADDLGMLLEQICFFYESSDTPPNLSPRVLRRYASAENLTSPNSSFGSVSGRNRVKRMSASMPTLHDIVTIPRLIPNFSMPVASRSAYLDRIERACVSLESVRVLPVEGGGTPNGSPPVIDRLVGSVAVRNLAFEKSVTARCTFDAWVSYVNVRAVYARSERVVHRSVPGQSLGTLEFDVFEFSVNLPVRWRTLRGERPRVELAIRYDVDGKTFWDNNDGQNYELIGTSKPSTALSKLRDDDYVLPCWTEFSGWNNVDTSCPYW